MAQYNKTKWIAMWMVLSMGFLFGLYGILFLWLLGYSIWWKFFWILWTYYL